MNDACRDYDLLLSGLLDGELSAGDRARLEDHIAGCARCRKEFESLRRLGVGTTAALAVPPPRPIAGSISSTTYTTASSGARAGAFSSRASGSLALPL